MVGASTAMCMCVNMARNGFDRNVSKVYCFMILLLLLTPLCDFLSIVIVVVFVIVMHLFSFCIDDGDDDDYDHKWNTTVKCESEKS